MSARTWGAIAFGSVLALVVGLRLNAAGQLTVATALISALLLCPLFALRRAVMAVPDEPPLPHVRVEVPPPQALPDTRAAEPSLPAPPSAVRRGGWPHLDEGASLPNGARGGSEDRADGDERRRARRQSQG